METVTQLFALELRTEASGQTYEVVPMGALRAIAKAAGHGAQLSAHRLTCGALRDSLTPFGLMQAREINDLGVSLVENQGIPRGVVVASTRHLVTS